MQTKTMQESDLHTLVIAVKWAGNYHRDYYSKGKKGH